MGITAAPRDVDEYNHRTEEGRYPRGGSGRQLDRSPDLLSTVSETLRPTLEFVAAAA